jgi:hypothetical protein
MPRSARATLTGALLLVAILTAASCGGSSGPAGSSGSTATTTPATVSTAAATGEAAKSADQILADARQAARAARSVHVVGRVPAQGSTIVVDLRLAAGKGGAGRFVLNGDTVALIRIGASLYLKADARFFERNGAPAGSGQILGGRWFKAPSSGNQAASFGSIRELTDLRQLVDRALTPEGALTKGPTTTVGGVPAVTLRSPKGSLAVSLRGAPYPLRILPDAGRPGQLAFRDWNAPVSLSPPAGAIDIAKLG